MAAIPYTISNTGNTTITSLDFSFVTPTELTLHADFSNVKSGAPTDFSGTNYTATDLNILAESSVTLNIDYTYSSLVYPPFDWLNLGTQDFTVECWVKLSDTPTGSQTIFDTGNLRFTYNGGFPNVQIDGVFGGNSSGGGLDTTWRHFALVRYGAKFTFYLDGSSRWFDYNSSPTVSVNNPGPSAVCVIGNNQAGTSPFDGYIDEFRITKGVARYTGPFTPPTQAFPSGVTSSADPYFSNVVLLLHMDGSNGGTVFTDSSSIPKIITPTEATTTTGTFKFGTASGDFTGSTSKLAILGASVLYGSINIVGTSSTGSNSQLVTTQIDLVAPTDPNYASVSLLLHFEGSNGSTTFIDNSPNPKVGSAGGFAPVAQISTADFKFGNSSAYFGGNDFIQYSANSGFQFGSGDYSIEMWVKPTGVTAEQHLIAVQNPATWSWTSSAFHLFIIGGSVYFRSFQGPVPLTISPIGPISAGVWSHVYAGRSGNTLYGAINGVITSIDCTGHSQNIVTQNVVLGRHGDYDYSLYYTGYMDEVRITKGIGRYTANFTPPTEPFPDS